MNFFCRAVVGEGEEDDSPLQEANQHGFKRKKNRKTIAAFFKSSLSPSASSSSSSSYYASSTNAARSPSSYSPAYDDDEDEDFAADEDAFGDASRGGLTFFKRKLRNALTCPAAKILLGLGGIVALGKYHTQLSFSLHTDVCMHTHMLPVHSCIR